MYLITHLNVLLKKQVQSIINIMQSKFKVNFYLTFFNAILFNEIIS